jgi:hypothetical protein
MGSRHVIKAWSAMIGSKGRILPDAMTCGMKILKTANEPQ